MHEVLTLQLGHSANYVGTHFWNTQQAYFTYSEDAEPTPIDHDVHFRAGIGAGGVETYTPRTVIYDLKGGFGSLKKINALYKIGEDVNDKNRGEIWNNNVIVQREPRLEVHPYITSLETGTEPAPLTTESVRYWSDFSNVYYHPRSIVQLYQYEVGSAIKPFENHTDGRGLFASIDKDCDILDNDIRYFVEECDHMQGFQMFTTTDDGWGGFASEYMLALRDEFPKTVLWTWGIERRGIEKRIPRTLALANALSTLVPLSSIYVPMVSPPPRLPNYIEMDQESLWHSSALLSTAIESITLQTRMRDQASGPRLADISAVLNPSGSRNISLLSMAAPELTGDGKNPHTKMTINNIGLSWTRDGEEKHPFACVEVSRGAAELDPGWSRSEASMLEATPGLSFHTEIPFPVLDSYPKIFTGCKDTLSVACSLRTSSIAMDRLRRIRDTVLRFAPVESKEDLYNELSAVAAAYEEDWDSGSDSGDDE